MQTKLVNHLLTVKEVASLLQVHPLSVRRYIKLNKLPAMKVAGNIRIPEESVLSLMKKAPTSSEAPARIFKKLPERYLFDMHDPLWGLEGRGASITEDIYQNT